MLRHLVFCHALFKPSGSCAIRAAALKPESAVSGSSKPYPLETCLVSGEKLGEMGEPYEIVYEGRQIKFCCKKCPA